MRCTRFWIGADASRNDSESRMNTHFGQLDFSSARKDVRWLEKITSLFLRDAPEPPKTFSCGPVSIHYRGFEPTKADPSTALPHGSVIFWDGRLDNAADLLSELRVNCSGEISDAEIAAQAFGR